MLNILLTILTVAFLFILGCFIILNSLEERYRELEDEEPWNIDNILANCEVIEDGNLD